MGKYEKIISTIKLEFGNDKHIRILAEINKIKEKEKSLYLVFGGGKTDIRIRSEIATLKRQVVFIYEN